MTKLILTIASFLLLTSVISTGITTQANTPGYGGTNTGVGLGGSGSLGQGSTSATNNGTNGTNNQNATGTNFNSISDLVRSGGAQTFVSVTILLVASGAGLFMINKNHNPRIAR